MRHGRRNAIAGLLLVGCASVSLAGMPVFAWVASRFPVDAQAPLAGGALEILLLRGAMPLVVLAVLLLLTAPGLLLAAAFGRPRTAGEWISRAFVISCLMHAATLTLLKLVAGDVSSATCRGMLVAEAFVAWIVLAARGARATHTPWSLEADRRTIAWVLATPLLAVTLLLPRLFWQDFNPDGLELFTMGRSLVDLVLPRLPTGEFAGTGLGMLGAAYPVHWMLLFTGPIEAAARLPMVWYTAVLFAALSWLTEVDAPRRLSAGERTALVAALASFVAALVLNDSYHIYSTDIASPASIDLLLMVLVVAMFAAFWSGQRAWCIAFAVLAGITRSVPVMILALATVAVLLCVRERRRERIGTLVLAAIAVIVCSFLIDAVLAPAAGAPVAQGADHIGSRLRFIRLTDVHRILWLIVPSGFLPAVALPLWRRQDPLGRTLTIVLLGYFAFFYSLAFIALHHFALAMLLPAVVFWRMVLFARPAPSRALAAVATALALVGVALALPPAPQTIDRTMRQLGRSMLFTVGDYEGSYADYRTAFRSRDLLDTLFAPYDRVRDPATEFMGSPWVEVHYARHRGPIDSTTRYVILPATRQPPPDFTLLAADSNAALFVRDTSQWKAMRYAPYNVRTRSALYHIPRESMLRDWGEPACAFDFDLKVLLGRAAAHECPPGSTAHPSTP